DFFVFVFGALAATGLVVFVVIALAALALLLVLVFIAFIAFSTETAADIPSALGEFVGEFVGDVVRNFGRQRFESFFDSDNRLFDGFNCGFKIHFGLLGTCGSRRASAYDRREKIVQAADHCICIGAD